MGLLRKQPKQGQASDWIQPGQMIAQPGGPGGPGMPGPTVGPPVPARLRPVTSTGHGEWLRGALRLAPGSLLWTPDSGVSAQPVELATAAAMPVRGSGGSRKPAMIVDLQTPAGRFQLELDPDLFEMSQLLVAEEAAKRGGPTSGPGVF